MATVSEVAGEQFLTNQLRSYRNRWKLANLEASFALERYKKITTDSILTLKEDIDKEMYMFKKKY